MDWFLYDKDLRHERTVYLYEEVFFKQAALLQFCFVVFLRFF